MTLPLLCVQLWRLRKAPPRRPAPPPPDPAAAWRGGGVQLGESAVWCDARRGRDLVFLSHAHLDLLGGAGKTKAPRAGRSGARRPGASAATKWIASPRTLALLEAHGGAAGSASVLPVPMGRPLSLGALRLELFPSGHVPGAAQLLLVEASGRRVVYAGDVNPRGQLGEPAEVRGADALVIEAPLALLPGTLPPREAALGQLVEVVRGALAAGRTPVVLAPTLGVAQEAERALGAAGIPLRAHAAIRSWSEALRRVGVALPEVIPGAPLWGARGARGADAALLWPLELARSPSLARLTRPLGVALTGQAVVQDGPRGHDWLKEQLGAAVVIALADHADLPSLVEYVGHSGAREVHVTAGFGPQLVAALGAIGVETHPLGPPRQMELGW